MALKLKPKKRFLFNKTFNGNIENWPENNCNSDTNVFENKWYKLWHKSTCVESGTIWLKSDLSLVPLYLRR